MAEPVEVIRAASLAKVPHGFLGRKGGVSTGVVSGLDMGLRGMDPAECAAQILAAVEADREEVLVGAKEALFVRLKRHFPALISYAIKRAKVT